MIRSNDPKLKTVEGEMFNDEDFDDPEDEQEDAKFSKKVTYKDLIREDVLKRAKHGTEGSSDDEDDG
jgi:hypothetical protein